VASFGDEELRARADRCYVDAEKAIEEWRPYLRCHERSDRMPHRRSVCSAAAREDRGSRRGIAA
jgi:hypothetical protein